MLSRQLLPRVARPLARLASSSISSNKSPVPANEASSPSAVVQQSPNYPTTWSTSQRPRPQGQSGPRFEQTIMELQPNALSAMELISKEPIRVVNGRKAVCDGGASRSFYIAALLVSTPPFPPIIGGGPLGHPKIFINLDKPGPQPCGYCGLRFEQSPHHGHDH
ncbi:ubiquinone oxidoreductase 20 kd subunit [Cristinia sonorae]|uniref:Ubiquinone oxidoreductase 20 kd subunit n=1 Tax=Cristinia sonorae TaxID=1940300 RepID=A0A8K0UNM5_9AGAR|nr:ubiquinone oxidoreductase 20 kd subunit [Cristinia sonorae]